MTWLRESKQLANGLMPSISGYPVATGKVCRSRIVDCAGGLVVRRFVGTVLNGEVVNARLDTTICTLAAGESSVFHVLRGS